MIKLSARLNYIVEIIDSSFIAADIGSDHGKLACALLQTGKAERVVITDISRDCLQKAKRLIERENLLHRAAFCCTNGFNNIIQEFDTAVIAGMGGMEITDILTNTPDSVRQIILQPMKNAQQLRLYLQERGFFIDIDKKIICCGKFYDIIKINTKIDGQVLSEYDILFGKTNISEKGGVFYDFLIYEKGRIDNIIEHNKAGEELRQYRQKICTLLNMLY